MRAEPESPDPAGGRERTSRGTPEFLDELARGGVAREVAGAVKDRQRAVEVAMHAA